MVSLGIDLGTSAVKVCLVDIATKSLLLSARKEHNAAKRNPSQPTFDEQSPEAITEAVSYLLTNEISNSLLSKVTRITFTGQMHGVLLWNRPCSGGILDWWSIFHHDTSHLITWQDRRCSKDFLKELPPSPSLCPIATGYGCATLFWLKKHNPEVLRNYCCAGTIMDYFVSMLCGLETPVISTHNARSWGYFNIQTNHWEIEVVKNEDFPVSMLPKVLEPHKVAGYLQEDWCGIPKNTSIVVGLADFQCMVYSSIGMQNETAVLNIGTSAQLAVITHENTEALKPIKEQYPALDMSPYFSSNYIIFVAALTGGNVLEEFVTMLGTWITSLGIIAPSKEDIYSKLENLASLHREDTSLHVHPSLFGERHVPDQKGIVDGITRDTLSLGLVCKELYRGIIKNIADMMPLSILQKENVKRLVLTGNLLLKSTLMQELASEILNLPVFTEGACDAAYGASLRGIAIL